MDSNTVRLTTSEGENGDCFKVLLLSLWNTFVEERCSLVPRPLVSFGCTRCIASYPAVPAFFRLL